MTKPRLQGDVCLVTGGSRGLGKAMSLAFAREGAKVALTYRQNTAEAEQTLELLKSLGAEVLMFQGDVADSAHVQDTVKAVLAAWGKIDVLVNNAALTQVVPLAMLEEDEWDEVVSTTLKGAYLFSRAVLRGMIRKKRGHILNIGAFSSERMVESPLHFAAAKSGLRGMTEALALDVGKHNIMVNLLAPGLLDVGLGQMLLPHRLNEYREQCALGRVGSAAEVAELAVFLVSSENTFITGAKLVADGGL
ncbi:MAG TPA: SDR family oxidoreductase [Polyangiaceae bacterium]|nr:SDR family oxidoreductase [Polyangiaceae bacterium]